MADAVVQPRFVMTLVGTFALLALILAVVGLYGVMAYSVSQRTREIGIRVALGARPHEVVTLILRQGFTLTAIGVVVGVASAVGVTRTIAWPNGADFAPEFLHGLLSSGVTAV